MAVIRLDAFAGLNLEKDPRKPPFWQALVAKNLDVLSGSIEPIYGLASAYELATDLAAFVYAGAAGNSIASNSGATDACTDEIDIHLHLSATDWTPAAAQVLISRGVGPALLTQHFRVKLTATGTISLEYWNGSATSSAYASTATVGSAGAVDAEPLWIRITRSGTTGDINFYTSDDGAETWTQLGTTVASPVEAMAVPTGPIAFNVGCEPDGTKPFAGSLHRLKIFSEVDGDADTLVADLNPSDYEPGEHPCVLSSVDKGTGITLSGGNLAATLPGATKDAARTNRAVSTGKYSWRVTFTNSKYFSVGIANAVARTANVDDPSSVPKSVTLNFNGYIVWNDGYIWPGSNINYSPYIGALVQGDVITIAVDVDAKSISFSVNGAALRTLTDTGSPPPAPATTGTDTGWWPTGPIYPYVAGQANAGGSVVTLGFKSAPLPGYEVLDDTTTFASNLTGELWTVISGVTVISRGYKALYHLAGPEVDYDTAIFLAAGPNTDFALSPLSNNAERRVYYTAKDEHEPRVTNALMAAVDNAAAYPTYSYVLGVPTQPVIGKISASGGSGLVQDRAYVYTHVSCWGEEGAPSLPLSVTANETDATVLIERMGTTTRYHSGSPTAPTGIPVNVTFSAAPTPGFLRVQPSVAGYNLDVLIGDRVYLSSPGTPNPGNRDYLVSAVSTAGNGTFDIAASAWDMAANTTLSRVLPLNSFNIISCSGGASDDELTFYVDAIDGLRIGEKVGFENMTGLGQEEYFVSDLVTDVLGAPAFKVTNESAEAPTVGVTPYAYRVARHNMGETYVVDVTIAAGIVTVEVEDTAQMTVGDKVMIVGIMGAYQINGVRTILTIPDSTHFTFALAAIGAYVSGGVVMLAIPYNYREFTITNVTAAGGAYPTPFTITFTITEPHDFEVGEMALGYDIGGAIEANTVMVVSSVTATTVVCSSAQGITAYTSGGKLARVERQSRKRLYRTATGTESAEYQLVVELPSETSRYSDTKNDSALGYKMESDGWIQPPADMHSIIAHPHGFLQGLSGNIFCQSVPGSPHAWPISHQRALPADGVGLGQFGITTVAFTLDKPFLISGSEPQSMRRERYNAGESCTSKRSIANGLEGVAYRGKSGMHLIGIQGVNTTKNLLPESLFASDADVISVFYNNKLVWITSGAKTGYILDPAGGPAALTQFEVDVAIYEMKVSPLDGQLWVNYVDNGVAKTAPLFKVVGTPSKFTWESQYITFERPVSLAWMQIAWDWHLQSATMQARENTIIANRRLRGADRWGSINSHSLNGIEVNGDGFADLYTPDTADTTPTEYFLHLTVIAEPGNSRETEVFNNYVADDRPFRLEDGIKSDLWQVKKVGNARVTQMVLASTIDELKQV